MKKLAAGLMLATLLVACATSPLGRKQLLLLPDSQVDQMGVTAYAQMKSSQPLSSDPAQSDYVQCVTRTLLKQLPESGSWEVNVFSDESANAFALPGNKIGVNTGLLKVAQDQNQLAAVVGHEIGHVMARHGNERMSIQFATQTGMQLLQTISEADPEKKALVLAAMGMGAQYGVVLPFSREHESEADLIGLKLMAQAGFDPRASITLWQNMAKASGGSPPEFLSTHPSHSTRIRDLEKGLAEVMPLYQQALQAGLKPACKP